MHFQQYELRNILECNSSISILEHNLDLIVEPFFCALRSDLDRYEFWRHMLYLLQRIAVSVKHHSAFVVVA